MECAAYGMSGPEALRMMMARSTFGPWVATSDGMPGSMWGGMVPSLLGETITLWSLSGNAIRGNEKLYMERSQQFVDYIGPSYRVIYAPVAVQYRAAVRWLEWLKFRDLGMRYHVGGVEFGWFGKER